MIEQKDGYWRSNATQDEKVDAAKAAIAKLTPQEYLGFREIIKEIAHKGRSETARVVADFEWDENPMPVREWLMDTDMVGETGHDMYPVLRDDFCELFDAGALALGGYYEAVLCLHPDTRVPLLDGSLPTIKELAERWERDQTPFWVYSYVGGDVAPAQAIQPRQTGMDGYYRVTLDDGSTFVGNARHQMLRRNGEKVMIRDMEPGDSLMPFEVKFSSRKNKDTLDGYEKIKLLSGEWEYTHRLVAKSVLKDDGDEDTIHHADFRKTNNAPSNLRWMRWREHIELHAGLIAEWRKANPEKAAANDAEHSAHLTSFWEGEEGDARRLDHAERLRARNLKGNASAAGKFAWKNRSPEAKAAFSAMMVKRNKSAKQRQAVSESKRKAKGKPRKPPKNCEPSSLRSNVTFDAIKTSEARSVAEAARLLGCSCSLIRRVLKDAGKSGPKVFGERRGKRRGKSDVTLELITSAIEAGASTAGAVASKLGCNKTTVYRCLKKEGKVWSDLCELVGNHYVVSVEKIGHGPVYCLSVPGAGNFAISTLGADLQSSAGAAPLGKKGANSPLRSGVFSSNTGAI